MNLQNSLASGDLIKQRTSRAEIQELLRLSSRWLSDASIEQLSLEGRFNSAYEAALQLAVIPLRCSGYRTRSEGHHYVIFDVLPDLMGDDLNDLSQYFQTCRKKRNVSVYRRASAVSRAEVEELLSEVENFSKMVRRWVRENYQEYC